MTASAPHSTPEGRRRRSDAQRNIDAIVGSAMRVLAERPTASMQELAGAAGVHRATVHRHFATREELLRAVRERSLDEVIDVLGEPRLRELPPRAALERVTRRAVELGDRQRLYRVAAMFDDASDARSEDLRLPLLALFTRAQEAGAAPADRSAQALTLAWSGLLLVSVPQIAAGRLSVDGAVELILSFVSVPG